MRYPLKKKLILIRRLRYILTYPCFQIWTRRSSSVEIKKDSGSSRESTESEKQLSEIKKTMKSHMIVAALIATVAFAAAFTLPGGYVQSGSIDNQGMAVLSLPVTNGTDRYMATLAREKFRNFVIKDSIAMLLSMSAIAIYFVASFPIKDIDTVMAILLYGHVLTISAIGAMVFAFVDGLQAVPYPSPFLEHTTSFILLVFSLLIGVPFFLTLTPNPRWILYGKKVKSYTSM